MKNQSLRSLFISKEEYEKSGAWGLYTSIDVFDCNEEKICSENSIRNFTIELCNELKVRRHGDMRLILFGSTPDLFGWSMAQMIDTSLVSGHFIQKPRIAYVDIFSCAFYDAKPILDFVISYFEGTSFDCNSKLRNGHGVFVV